VRNFQVDEVELAGPPNVIHLRCLAAYITDAMRTAKSVSWEANTLLGIARQIAKGYGFTVIGDAVSPDVAFAIQTQNQESDLEFLQRLADSANYEFTVRGNKIVFSSRLSFEQQRSAAIVRRGDVTRFSFKAKTRRIYKAAQVSYQDPKTKTLISATATANPAPANGDTLKIVERCENGQQAKLKAAAIYTRRTCSKPPAS
jgi:phage protein D